MRDGASLTTALTERRSAGDGMKIWRHVQCQQCVQSQQGQQGQNITPATVISVLAEGCTV